MSPKSDYYYYDIDFSSQEMRVNAEYTEYFRIEKLKKKHKSK